MGIDFDFADSLKGFMEAEEARRLHDIALEAALLGPCLEIGSYCGKSAYFIGLACQKRNSVLFSVDHHGGSEEQQPGQAYFDPDLFDEKRGVVDTFPVFRQTLECAGLTRTVVPIVCESTVAGIFWSTPLSLLFIDGGHTRKAAFNDYRNWAGHVMPGGYLLIHDIFTNPDKGGQAPREVYETALASGNYAALEMTGTLGVLKRLF